jgi:hypothetical protein
MFLGGWQLWIKIIVIPPIICGQNAIVCFFVARPQENFPKVKEVKKIIWILCESFDISKKVSGTVANF